MASSKIFLGNQEFASESANVVSVHSGVDLGITANHSGVKTALNASGSASIYACRSWVNFNGTGTLAIRDSGNVSSITDNGSGDYTVNFTTTMPDANYAVAFAAGPGNGRVPMIKTSNFNDSSNQSAVTMSTTQLRVVQTILSSFSMGDTSFYCVSIFR